MVGMHAKIRCAAVGYEGVVVSKDSERVPAVGEGRTTEPALGEGEC